MIPSCRLPSHNVLPQLHPICNTPSSNSIRTQVPVLVSSAPPAPQAAPCFHLSSQDSHPAVSAASQIPVSPVIRTDITFLARICDTAKSVSNRAPVSTARSKTAAISSRAIDIPGAAKAVMRRIESCITGELMGDWLGY